jgi:hypothetical protein
LKIERKKNRHGLAESALFEMEMEDLKRKEYGLYINIINQCFFVHQSLETTWAINSYKSYCDPVLHKFIDLAKGSSCSSPKSHTIDSPEVVVKHLIKTIQPLKMPEGSTF